MKICYKSLKAPSSAVRVILILCLIWMLGSGCANKPSQRFTIQPIFNKQLANSYILADAGEAVVVDPAAADKITETIKDQKLQLKYIVITHGHFDHIAGADQLKSKFPTARLLIHPKDLDKPGNPDKNLSTMFGTRVKVMSPMATVKEGDSIKVGNTAIKVLDTPGHTEGSIILLAGNNMISGDTLFKGSVGRTDFPGSNPPDMKESLKKVLTLPDDMKVFPGHGELTVLGEEKKSNPFLKALQEE